MLDIFIAHPCFYNNWKPNTAVSGHMFSWLLWFVCNPIRPWLLVFPFIVCQAFISFVLLDSLKTLWFVPWEEYCLLKPFWLLRRLTVETPISLTDYHLSRNSVTHCLTQHSTQPRAKISLLYTNTHTQSLANWDRKGWYPLTCACRGHRPHADQLIPLILRALWWPARKMKTHGVPGLFYCVLLL